MWPRKPRTTQPSTLDCFDVHFHAAGRPFQMCVDLRLQVASIARLEPAQARMHRHHDVELPKHRGRVSVLADARGLL